MLYHCKGPEKPGVLLLGPTGISAVNRDGTNIQDSPKKDSAKKVLTSSIAWVLDVSFSKICVSTNQGTLASSFMRLPQFEVYFLPTTLPIILA